MPPMSYSLNLVVKLDFSLFKHHKNRSRNGIFSKMGRYFPVLGTECKRLP